MRAPKSKTTFRIFMNIGTAGQYADSSMTVVELKGQTPQEKGDHYLKISLEALKELAALLEDKRLSKGEKAAFNRTYETSVARYDDMVRLRDRLLSQKKSFRKILVNFFVRDSEASRFLDTTYLNYSTIRRTSDELHRRLLPVRNDVPAPGSLDESNAPMHEESNASVHEENNASVHEEGNASVHDESSHDVVEDNVPISGLPPNETLGGIDLDVYGEEEENEAFTLLNRIGTLTGGDSEDEDDSVTVRPSSAMQSWPPSPTLTVIYNMTSISHSVLSINSEVVGAAVIAGHSGGSE